MVDKCASVQYTKVGGEFFETVLYAMNDFGRVSVCGSISTYNVEDPPKGKHDELTSYIATAYNYSL